MNARSFRHAVMMLPELLALSLVCHAANGTVEVAYATYLGGSGEDVTAGDQVTDAAGNLYIAARTTVADFPVTPGAFDTTHNGGPDGVVAKLDPQGNIVWATFLGTPGRDDLYGIRLDAQGNVVVAGTFYGPGAPTTAGALQRTFAGGDGDGFVAKLKPDGSGLVWATYVGTPAGEVLRGMVLDASGNPLLATGAHPGNPWPGAWTAGAFQSAPQGGIDTTIIKLKNDGSNVLWSTYIGGSADEDDHSNVAVDASDRVYVLTTTQSANMPTSVGAYDQTYNGGQDVYVIGLTSDGKSMRFATYLGTSQNDGAGGKRGIAIAPDGSIVLGIWTESSTFPTTPGAFRTQPVQFTPWGVTDATVKLSPSGDLLASTYIGSAEGVGVDGAGNIYTGGTTSLPSFPVTADAYQPTHRGNGDGYICKFSPDLAQLLYGTYIGGSGVDGVRMTWAEPGGTFYAFGTTDSADFPVLNAVQPSYAGGSDIFIVKITPTGTSSLAPPKNLRIVP